MASARDRAIELYRDFKMSIPEVHKETKIPLSTIRWCLKKANVLRSREEAILLAKTAKKYGRHLLGKKRKFTKTWIRNIGVARRAWGEKNARGISVKADGRVEITRGKNKGRGVHVVMMEERLGRHLLPDEVVHHVDENKSNNDWDNLALLTNPGHARLHRLLEAAKGLKRKRNKHGRYM